MTPALTARADAAARNTPVRAAGRYLYTLGHAELLITFSAEQIMGMPAQTVRQWTAEEVRTELLSDRAWPRYELIDGELIVASAASLGHYRTAMWLFHLLRHYLEEEPVGEAMMSIPADLELRPGTISQPDVFVPPREEAVHARQWADIRHLLLAIEILSPSTARYDRGIKRKHYQAAGVGEYWIVDPESRLVERWRPHDDRPEIIRQRLRWLPPGAKEPLEFELQDMFAAGRMD